jgi:hypothetical protein
LTNAVNFELAPPPVCKSTANIINGTEIEKILCHVNRELTAYRAKMICEANGMRLFQPKSSANAQAALVSFGRSRFGGSPKAEFYILGRRGNRCQTARGNGALSESYCESTFSALCEYFDVNGLVCEHEYASSCEYNSAVTKDNMTMYIKDPDAYLYEYVRYYVNRQAGTRFLPVDLATTFPNLEHIFAEGCSIQTLNRRTFAGLTKINDIRLSQNQLTVLQSSIFAGLTTVQNLYLGKLVDKPKVLGNEAYLSLNFHSIESLDNH